MSPPVTPKKNRRSSPRGINYLAPKSRKISVVSNLLTRAAFRLSLDCVLCAAAERQPSSNQPANSHHHAASRLVSARLGGGGGGGGGSATRVDCYQRRRRRASAVAQHRATERASVTEQGGGAIGGDGGGSEHGGRPGTTAGLRAPSRPRPVPSRPRQPRHDTTSGPIAAGSPSPAERCWPFTVHRHRQGTNGQTTNAPLPATENERFTDRQNTFPVVRGLGKDGRQ